MEINKVGTLMALALIALPLGFGAMSYQSKNSDFIDRKLASQKPVTVALLHTMKLSAISTVQIESVNAVEVGGEFTLRSNIELTRVSSRMRWEWDIPRGLTALTPTSGYIEASSEPTTVTIRLRHDSPQNMKINLRIFSVGDQKEIQVGVGHYDTLDESRIQTETADLKARQDQYMEEHPFVSRDDSEPKPEN